MSMEGMPAATAPSSQGNPASSATEAKSGVETRSPEAKQAEIERRKVKIDGKEQDVSIDDLVAEYQKGKAGDKRLQEAAQLRKDVDTLVKGLASGDEKSWGWLKKNVPADVYKQITLKQAYEFMEHDSLPPERKKEMELDEREKRLHAEEERREQERQSQEWTSQVQGSAKQIESLIDSFKERSGKSPSSAELYRMTEFMLSHVRKHDTLPDVDKLFQRAQKSLEIDTLDTLKSRSTNPEELIKWLPDDLKKVLRKAFLGEATSGHPKRYEAPSETRSDDARRAKKPTGIDDAFNNLEKRFKSKGR